MQSEMFDFLLRVFFSVISASGIAIVVVEKRRAWPVRRFHLIAQRILGKIHRRLPKMLFCSVCTGFEVTLLTDLVICVIGLFVGYNYWAWPFSGFITGGFLWTLYQFLPPE